MVRLIILLFLLSVNLSAQSPIDKALNYLQEFTVDEHDFEAISITLSYYESSPINLNDYRIEEVSNFPLLNIKHWSAINKYKRINGNILSANELKNLPHFSTELVQIIKPFIRFKSENKSGKLKGFLIQKNDYIFENSKGYKLTDSSSYKGSKIQNDYRLNIENNKTKAFATWKKDRGEPINFSHLKSGIQFNSKKIIQQINLGSFSTQFGEGLIHSNKFISPKNLPPEKQLGITKNLSSNSSSNNFNFENGLAIKVKTKKYQSTSFYSFKKLNGSMDNDTLTSIKKDGYYRTYDDIEKRNQSNLSSIGTSQQLTLGYLSILLNSKIHLQEYFYQPIPSYYNKNYGHQNLFNNSLSFRYFNGNILFKGESAIDKDFDYALNYFVAGRLDELFILVNVRYFESDYNSFQSLTFSEFNRVQNEKGFLASIQKQAKNISLFGSIDLFSTQNPKFRTSRPSIGKELILQSNLTLSEQSDLKLFLKQETKQRDNKNSQIDQLETTQLLKNYVQLKIQLQESLNLKIRADHVLFKSETTSSKGQSAYVQLGKTIKKQAFNMRITSFKTDDWDSRIYLYENDVLYTFSVPSLNGKGFRFFFNYKLNIGRKHTLWAKFAQFYYPEQESIGSGKDEILGNTKTEFKIQYRIKI